MYQFYMQLFYEYFNVSIKKAYGGSFKSLAKRMYETNVLIKRKKRSEVYIMSTEVGNILKRLVHRRAVICEKEGGGIVLPI